MNIYITAPRFLIIGICFYPRRITKPHQPRNLSAYSVLIRLNPSVSQLPSVTTADNVSFRPLCGTGSVAHSRFAFSHRQTFRNGTAANFLLFHHA